MVASKPTSLTSGGPWTQTQDPARATMADDAAKKAPPAKKSLPSELIMSARWDSLLERVVINSGAGALMGLAASLVLSRGRTARWAITFFGAGTGVGMAVERSSAEMSAAEREK